MRRFALKSFEIATNNAGNNTSCLTTKASHRQLPIYYSTPLSQYFSWLPRLYHFTYIGVFLIVQTVLFYLHGHEEVHVKIMRNSHQQCVKYIITSIESKKSSVKWFSDINMEITFLINLFRNICFLCNSTSVFIDNEQSRTWFENTD